jgi:transposase InsO family protein
MSCEVADRLIELRLAKPYWGPKKLLAMLREAALELALPSAVSELFWRTGLSEPRRRRVLGVAQPFRPVLAANDLWCIDFKGWFRTRDGKRCDPLTVSDGHSRFILGLQRVEPVTEAVEAVIDGLFKRYGLPAAMRSDNGPPRPALAG